MSRHSVAQAAAVICEGSSLRHPERWVAERLWDGRFPGLKIGREWYMTDADIESALETCRRGSHTPGPCNPVETAPAAAASIIDGLSARARRLRSAS